MITLVKWQENMAMKDRDKKGARFRDVLINRRKVQAQT